MKIEDLGTSVEAVAKRSIVIKVLLWVLFAVNVLRVLGLWMVVHADDRFVPFTGFMNGLTYLLSLPLLIVMMMWLFRANDSLGLMGLRSRFSPSWAAWSLVVPIANLVVPFQAAKEALELSCATGRAGKDFLTSGLLKLYLWWAATVLCFVMICVETAMMESVYTRQSYYVFASLITVSRLIMLVQIMGLSFFMTSLNRALSAAMRQVESAGPPPAPGQEQALPA